MDSLRKVVAAMNASALLIKHAEESNQTARQAIKISVPWQHAEL